MAKGTRALLRLRAALGFVLGIVALFIGAIALLTYWQVHNVRSRRS